MAWTSPKTFAATEILTASELNTHLRDNLNETAPAKATTAGRHFVVTADNTIAERAISNSISSGSINVTGTSYGNTGPSVTVTTGTRALVLFGCHLKHNTDNAAVRCSVSVSGATTIAASDDWNILLDGQLAGNPIMTSVYHMFKTLNAGSNTFNMQYRVASGNADFERREIVVIAL